jgi:hypothetical protein
MFHEKPGGRRLRNVGAALERGSGDVARAAVERGCVTEILTSAM